MRDKSVRRIEPRELKMTDKLIVSYLKFVIVYILFESIILAVLDAELVFNCKLEDHKVPPPDPHICKHSQQSFWLIFRKSKREGRVLTIFSLEEVGSNTELPHS